MNQNNIKHAGKVISYRRFYAARYPNAASRNYYVRKALDLALATAISVGTATTLLFMLAIF